MQEYPVVSDFDFSLGVPRPRDEAVGLNTELPNTGAFINTCTVSAGFLMITIERYAPTTRV